MKQKSVASRNAARRARTPRKFSPNAVCQWCGYSNPVALLMVEKTLLEEHHVFGAANDDGTRIPLCRNCHAEMTVGIQETGATMRHQRSIFETLVEVNKALEVFHKSAAIAHGKFASDLERKVVALDERLPEWREIEEER